MKQILFSRMIRFAEQRGRRHMAKAAIKRAFGYSGPLVEEYETYRRQLGGLVKDAGKYVLVHQSDIIAVYDTYEAALTAGYEQFGLSPFLVKQIGAPPVLAH